MIAAGRNVNLLVRLHCRIVRLEWFSIGSVWRLFVDVTFFLERRKGGDVALF